MPYLLPAMAGPTTMLPERDNTHRVLDNAQECWPKRNWWSPSDPALRPKSLR